MPTITEITKKLAKTCRPIKIGINPALFGAKTADFMSFLTRFPEGKNVIRWTW
jgi:hypothetical protein